MKDISVIIPMYNVEKYIAKSILSVSESDWGSLTYEIVIVDDESPDNSLEIARHFASQNSNISIISQQNKGLGGARNTGIKHAKGKYLFFLDSDDYLLDTFPKLLQIALYENLDVLEFAARLVDENYSETKTIFHNETTKVLSGGDYVATVPFANSACNKLYLAAFIRENGILFIEQVYIEDAPFNVEVLYKAKKVKAVDIIAVAYLQNPASITRKKRTGKRLEKFLTDSIHVTARINSFSTFNANVKANKKISQKTAFFVSGILLMILRSDFDYNQKLSFLNLLKKEQLYPGQRKTGNTLRDFFMKIMTTEAILKFLFRIKV